MESSTIPARTHSQGDLWRACCSRLARLSRVIQKIFPRWAHRFAPPESTRKHAPWTDFSGDLASDNQPFSNFPTDFSKLPTVSWVIPNLDNDVHDGTIQQGDRWLQTNLMAYVTWTQNNNSLLIVQFDEDDGTSGNHIVTIFVGPMVRPGKYREKINHYNVLRTIEDTYGLTHLGRTATATSITDVWK
jgi:acid phosphatase